MRITVQHPKDQLRLLDEFIPGQPVANTGYLRRMPARYFAAAVPQAAAAIGDRRGPVIGERHQPASRHGIRTTPPRYASAPAWRCSSPSRVAASRR